MGIGNTDKVMENLRKQLRVAVRSVQWSYAVFWSLSRTQQGVLEWGEGYYNGDIKTRKTVPTTEVNADKLGLRRSEQLRELYMSLLEGDSELGSTRPATILSPEDLSDLEWYYLVCMSFTFKLGQSLPGKAFTSGHSVWLCNAQDADSKKFFRSLLAKSASIKTVICFPHMGGVIELGVTDLLSEDPDLIQHVKTSLLEFAKPDCTEKSSPVHQNADYDEDHFGAKIPEITEQIPECKPFVNLNPAVEDTKFRKEMLEELNNMGSPDDCSNECCGNNQQREDSFMLECHANDVVADDDDDDDDDDDLSHCIQESFNSSISQAFMSPKKMTSIHRDRNTNDVLRLKQIQDCNDTKFGSLDLGNEDVEDLHYKRILEVISQQPHNLVTGKALCSCGHRSSSFVPWNKERGVKHLSKVAPQRALKKILFTVPLMIARSPLDPPTKDDNKATLYGFSENRREDDKYVVLQSLVPSIKTVDKMSILNDTIEYLKELEARVEELESCVNHSELNVKARRKIVDLAEQTSDNYHNKSQSDGKKTWMNKRKASDIDETEDDPLLPKAVPFDNNGPLDVKVKIIEEEVVIELKCPWREFLLLDIMDAVNNLSLDAHTVQSSTVDDMLILSLKSKFRGEAFASAGMIKQALRRMVGFC
ncbi:hypothetical protein V2J09_001519 [Rumex salicifolius]